MSIVEAIEPTIFLTAGEDSGEELAELRIRPGQTVSAMVQVRRNGYEGQISLGRDDAGAICRTEPSWTMSA